MLYLLPRPAPRLPTPDYSNGGSFNESTAITTSKIDGGTFVREKDGADGITVSFAGGEEGITITGGTFTSSNPTNVVRDNGVEMTRGYNIGLVQKWTADNKPAASTGTDTSGKPIYNYYTEQDIRDIFATNDEELIRKAFLSSDSEELTEEEAAAIPLPTLEEALATLEAKNAMDKAISLDAWQFTAVDILTDLKDGDSLLCRKQEIYFRSLRWVPAAGRRFSCEKVDSLELCSLERAPHRL